MTEDHTPTPEQLAQGAADYAADNDDRWTGRQPGGPVGCMALLVTGALALAAAVGLVALVLRWLA